MSPMAFIAAHGSYTAINGISSTENSQTLAPFAGPQPQLDAGWYQHYASHYALTSMGYVLHSYCYALIIVYQVSTIVFKSKLYVKYDVELHYCV